MDVDDIIQRAKSVKRMLRTKSQEIPVFQGQGEKRKLKEMGQSSEESEVGIIHESQEIEEFQIVINHVFD